MPGRRSGCDARVCAAAEGGNMRQHEHPHRLENSAVDQKSRSVRSMWRSIAAAALLCTAAAGCSMAPYNFPSPQPGPSPRAPAGNAPGPGSEPEPPRQSAASTALLEQGREAREAGRYAEATASLERALRIDPNNALLWIELAEVKAADGDRDQARQMARKALTLAAGNRSIEARARRLL